MLGDFHRLPQADASIDAAFCIECFCHALDLPRAMREVARVLRPGGSFTLFDGYLPRPAAALAPEEALAVELVTKGLSIDGLQTVSDPAAITGLRTRRIVSQLRVMNSPWWACM